MYIQQVMKYNYPVLYDLGLWILQTAGPLTHRVQLHLDKSQAGLLLNISRSKGISDFENEAQLATYL